jgi:hypothetical protein
VSDIVYQCQSVAAGLVAGVDGPSIRHDVTMLLRVYRGVRPEARIAIGPGRTTPRRELTVAQANLEAGCAVAQARRLGAGARQ